MDLIERHGSEFLGVCLDTGNNISLLDDPMDTIAKLAPFAVTTHFKDVAVKEYSEGFLLSEVPLGHGILDLAQVVDSIRKARPRVRLNLEMITRDPLKVPCLIDRYWLTFPERSGVYLARTLRLVHDHPPAEPLPHVSGLEEAARRRQEEGNVKQCLAYARKGRTASDVTRRLDERSPFHRMPPSSDREIGRAKKPVIGRNHSLVRLSPG